MNLSSNLLLLALGSWATLIGIVSGAAGAALLELYYKPRRDRQTAARVLSAEIAHNTTCLLLHAHERRARPVAISADLRISRLGFDAVAGLLGEMPTAVLRSVLLLYNRYDEANRSAALYSRLLDQLEILPPDYVGRAKLEKDLKTVVDAFNTNVDISIHQGQSLLKQLVPLAKQKETAAQNEPAIDQGSRVREMMLDPQLRMEASDRFASDH